MKHRSKKQPLRRTMRLAVEALESRVLLSVTPRSFGFADLAIGDVDRGFTDHRFASFDGRQNRQNGTGLRSSLESEQVPIQSGVRPPASPFFSDGKRGDFLRSRPGELPVDAGDSFTQLGQSRFKLAGEIDVLPVAQSER